MHTSGRVDAQEEDTMVKMTPGVVEELTDIRLEQLVRHSSVPVLVDLWAVWCGPCRTIAPIVETLAATYEGTLTVGKLNVDDYPEAAATYRVGNIPTLLLFKDGKEVDRIGGVVSKEMLALRIEQLLN